MAASGRRHRTETALSDLRAAITTGWLRGDDMLPGERDLSARFSVSRTTLRRMLSELVAEGVLRHRQGVGTFIIPPEPLAAPRDARPKPVASTPPPASTMPAAPAAPAVPPPATARLAGFGEEMRARGVILLSRVVERAVVLPTPDEAMMLACSAGERIVRLTRVRSVGSLALSVERACVPCRFIGEDGTPDASLYAALAAQGHPPVRALQRVQAIAMNEDEATTLGVATGTTGVSVRRTAYLADGRCCDFTRSTYPAARYDAMTEVHLPLPAGLAGR